MELLEAYKAAELLLGDNSALISDDPRLVLENDAVFVFPWVRLVDDDTVVVVDKVNGRAERTREAPDDLNPVEDFESNSPSFYDAATGQFVELI